MIVTTRGGKQNIDPLMPSEVEILIKRDEDDNEVSGKYKSAREKKAEVAQTSTPILTEIGEED